MSSSEVDGSSSAIQENNESKQDNALPSGGHQHSWVLTSPNYSFGFVPPMLGTQLTQFEYQTHDASQLPSFIVSLLPIFFIVSSLFNSLCFFCCTFIIFKGLYALSFSCPSLSFKMFTMLELINVTI